MDFANFRKGGSFRNEEKQKFKELILKPKFSYAFSKNNYFLETSFLINYFISDFKFRSLVNFSCFEFESIIKILQKT